MAAVAGTVVGVAVVVAWMVVVLLAVSAWREPSVWEAERLRVDLAAAHRQTEVAQTTAASMAELVARAGLQ